MGGGRLGRWRGEGLEVLLRRFVLLERHSIVWKLDKVSHAE